MRTGALVLIDPQNPTLGVNGYGWTQNFLPVGRLSLIVNELDSLGVDEICLVNPNTNTNMSAQMQSFWRLVQQELVDIATPIIIGGQVDCAEVEGFTLPSERLLLSSSFVERDLPVIDRLAELRGKQAIVAALPLRLKDSASVEVYHSRRGFWKEFSEEDARFCQENADEILIFDCVNEGRAKGFSWGLLDQLDFTPEKLIITGGITSKCILEAEKRDLSAVFIDNQILFSEGGRGFA